MTEYTITRFDPDGGTIEVQFSNWPNPLAIPVTLDSMGMLPTGHELDALIGLYAPQLNEVARIASVANAPNQADLSALIGVSRTAELPSPSPEPVAQTAVNLGIIQPGETIPQVNVTI
jgi:hypothetical protein